MNKLKLMTIIGTRPEIIRLSAVIKKCDVYFDQILVHTGQNYDYNLNGVFFHDLQLADPEVYMNAVGADLGETMGNIISESYKLMAAIHPRTRFVLTKTELTVLNERLRTLQLKNGMRVPKGVDPMHPQRVSRRAKRRRLPWHRIIPLKKLQSRRAIGAFPIFEAIRVH